MDDSMTAKDLQAFIKAQFSKENECFEWKEWRSLKSNISGRKGEDLVSYVSALSNMDGGCIVIGVQDKTLAVTGIQDFADYNTENVIHRILGKTPSLPSMGLRVEALQASDTGAVVWLVHVPRHAPRQPVYAHDKAWQRDGDSLVELRADRLEAILCEPLNGEDWSAVLVPQASWQDLDPTALALARKQYGDGNASKPWASQITSWSDTAFLDKARLSINGVLTRAALLLLGKAECVHLLSGHPAEIAWKLPAKRVLQPYGTPFLLTVNEVLANIRRHNIKLFPSNQLMATEVPNYDVRVILEALNNCIAHQDYERHARILVIEHDSHLEFHSEGAFFDGKPADYYSHNRTPNRYRNKYLTDAMRELGLIDRGGFGISEMYVLQRKRFLPLPDYELSEPLKVVVRVFGQTIDENYARLLMERADLPLEQAIWLDRVQKKSKVDNAHITELRKAKLIEGRKPNWTVSASIAAITNSQNEYILNKGFDDNYYKRRMLQRLEEFGPTSGKELRALILDQLPRILSAEAKETKIKNLRTALRLQGIDGKKIEISPDGPARGTSAIWRIRRGN
jgi:ATP-dependent DNA helicase RecG